MPPKRGKKGKRRGDDSSDDDVDMDALDPLAGLRASGRGKGKGGGGDGDEDGSEKKKKPLTKKEKRRLEEEQRRQKELEAASAGGDSDDADNDNEDHGDGAEEESEAPPADDSKPPSSTEFKKSKAGKGKKGKGAKNEGDGDKDIGEVGDAGAGGEEDRPKKPLSKKERRRLDEEERRQRELAEIEALAAAEDDADAGGAEGADENASSAPVVASKKGGKKDKKKKGKKGRRGADSDDDGEEGDLSRCMDTLSIADDGAPAGAESAAREESTTREKVPPAKMSKKERRKAEAAAMAAAAAAAEESADDENDDDEDEAAQDEEKLEAEKAAAAAAEEEKREAARIEKEEEEEARKAAKKAAKKAEKAKLLMEEEAAARNGGDGDEDDGQKKRISKKDRKKAKQQGSSKKKDQVDESPAPVPEETNTETPRAGPADDGDNKSPSPLPPAVAAAEEKAAVAMDVDGASGGGDAAPASVSPPAAPVDKADAEVKKPKKKTKLMRKLEEAARLKKEAEMSAGVKSADGDAESRAAAEAAREEKKRKEEKAARKAKKEAAKEKESKVRSILEDLDDAEYYGSDHEEREKGKKDGGANRQETVEEELARLVAAAEAGGKTATARQRKKILQDIEARRRAAANEAREELAHRDGAQFGCSQTAVTAGDLQWNNSLDITIDAFSISAHDKTLFKDASLQVVHGRKYGLVGPNGAGKSTLLKMIASGELKIPPRIDCLYVEQEVVADDTPAVIAVMKADKARWSLLEEERKINRLLRADPENDKLNDRLQQIHEELHTSGGDGAEAQARRILFGLGFDDTMQVKATKHFSGGWRMRISLARALFMAPTLLMLDEPTNHLDLNAVIWLDDYLQKWKKTLLVVSHDQDFLNSVCEEILHLDQKKINQYKGNYDQFKEMEAQKRRQQAKEWEKQQRKLAALKKGGQSKGKAEDTVKKSKFREPGGSKKKKNDAVAAGTGEVETAQLVERPREYVVTLNFPEVSMLSPPVLEVMDVMFRYSTGPVILKDVNFGLDQSSRICIVGPNGAGKTTLLKLLTGALDATEGFVRRNPRMRAGIYNQHFVDRLPMDIDPTSYLRSKFSDQCDYQTARNLLGRFGLEGHAHTIKMRDLSGGQKARVVFCELSLQAPHVLFLDEPTNNLDIESIDALCDAVTKFNGGVVVVTHDARLIEATECRLWIVDEQEVTPWQGEFDEYREDLLRKMEEKIAAQEQARMEKDKSAV